MHSTTMLEYSKAILEKVSFDPELFQKELKKALKMLNPEEVRELILWCKAHFSYELPIA
ncbi:MAG TPA: hypothetical protein VNJ07_00755 [Chitinophagales bacterium]|nr:hypothetical protein [Chitinophagales bacterium]